MKQKELMSLVDFVVYKWLLSKPELEEFRQDLKQEGYECAFAAMETYDPKQGDLKLYLDYRVRWSVAMYIRDRERKHFKKRPVDDGPFWDIALPVDIYDVPSQDHKADKRRELFEALATVDLTPKEQEFLTEYLRTNELTTVAETMGISRQGAFHHWKSIVTKAQALDK